MVIGRKCYTFVCVTLTNVQFVHISMCNTYKCNPYTLIRIVLHTVEYNLYVFKEDSHTLTIRQKKILNHRKIGIFPVFQLI